MTKLQKMKKQKLVISDYITSDVYMIIGTIIADGYEPLHQQLFFRNIRGLTHIEHKLSFKKKIDKMRYMIASIYIAKNRYRAKETIYQIGKKKGKLLLDSKAQRSYMDMYKLLFNYLTDNLYAIKASKEKAFIQVKKQKPKTIKSKKAQT